MVQVTFDTNNDTLEELEESLRILQAALQRRKAGAGEHAEAKPKHHEETMLDAGFMKITVKDADEPDGHDASPEQPVKQAKHDPAAPTLNELLNESLSEEELAKMFKEQSLAEQTTAKPKKQAPKDEEKTYLEIVDYGEEK